MRETKTEKKEKKKKLNKIIILGIIIGLAISTISFILNRNVIFSLIIVVITPILLLVYIYFKSQLEKSARIKKIEFVFPDFLQLMSSNLRAGITIDRSMLLSAREEFDPLDKEIQKTGRDIATGKNIELALLDMSKRTGSEKIHRTILLINSGIRAGGNLAILLQEISVNMRERNFVEKRAASNVLMYVIFIFLAVSVGAPTLFSLSNILVETLTNLLSGLPTVTADIQTPTLPFALSKVNVSVNFVRYFSIVFIIVTDILASLILGLVSRGEEKEGLKFLLPILFISLSVFFGVKLFLSGFISGLFGY